MALTAQNIAIDPNLAGTLAGTGAGTNAYNKIKQGYGQAQGAFGADASARGMNGGAATGAGSYYGTQAPISQGLATGGLESALGGGLANTSYQNALQQRGFNQNVDLANQAAAMNKPDMLQQILGGIGSVGGTAAKIYGAWGTNAGGGSTGGSTTGSMPSDLSLIPGGGMSQYYSQWP